jgi:hypothetical protein
MLPFAAMPRRALIAVALAAAIVASCTPASVSPHTRLEDDLAPLRRAFNESATVRLVMIASPT